MDSASLAELREALPGWTIDVVIGATTDSLAADWNPDMAALLVIGCRDSVAETLGLCRFLSFCTTYSENFRQDASLKRLDAPILVVVPPGQESLAKAAMRAGAFGCLTPPIDAQELIRILANANQSRQSKNNDRDDNADITRVNAPRTPLA